MKFHDFNMTLIDDFLGLFGQTFCCQPENTRYFMHHPPLLKEVVNFWSLNLRRELQKSEKGEYKSIIFENHDKMNE